ncbi:glycosyltransferase family 39 protein [Gordonia sinesedis]
MTGAEIAPDRQSPHGDLPGFAVRHVALIAAVVAVVLTALSGRYGFHRDELYFLAAGDHPAWGYVDQPPLTPMIARAVTELFGAEPAGLRVAATLATLVTLVLAALICREFGGGTAAQTMTAAAVATSAFILTVGHMLSTPTLDIPIWLGLCWVTLRMLRTGDSRWFVAAGVLIGVGIGNKFLIALPAVALPLAVLAVGPRRILLSPWLIVGALAAAAIAAPTVVWQATHGWPQLAVAREIADEDGALNRVTFLPYLIVYLSPPYAVLWIAGLWRLWRAPELRWARAFPVAVAAVVAALIGTGGKPYYAIGLLVVALAAGAEPVWRWCVRRRLGWAVPAAVAVSAAINAVIALPVLPVRAIGPVLAMNREPGEQVGWPELVDQVAVAWRAIPAGDRDGAVIVTQNYGQAGAIDRYGPELGLSPAYSGHMSYADWGPPPAAATGPVVVVHFPDDRRLRSAFVECRLVATVDNGVGVDNSEQGTEIDLCRRPAQPWTQIWQTLRHY